jgi:hypothetical protein
MSVELAPKYDWMLRYTGEVARLQNRFPDPDEAESAWEQFGADNAPEECAWEQMIDGGREA